MKNSRVLFLVVLVLSFAAPAAAQIPTMPTPTPSAAANPIMRDNSSFDRLRSVEMLTRDKLERHPLLDPAKGIYRKPNKKETEVLAVSEQVLNDHAAFLREQDTGIIKLNADSTCVSDPDVVVVTEACAPYKMPGSGTSFSFRTESYRLPRLADIILFWPMFRTGGVYQQVIMTNIGDVPIDGVTLETKGMKFLLGLKPVKTPDEFVRFDDKLVAGIEADGLLYRKGHLVKEHSTYILRSIAYRGKYMRSVDKLVYNELDFDKRRDSIVTFRIVERDSHGNITIIWKRLKDAEAPKLDVD